MCDEVWSNYRIADTIASTASARVKVKLFLAESGRNQCQKDDNKSDMGDASIYIYAA